MNRITAYKLTGAAVLILGLLFFLRDISDDLNFIGKTSGWTILLVLLGAGLVAERTPPKLPVEVKMKSGKK